MTNAFHCFWRYFEHACVYLADKYQFKITNRGTATTSINSANRIMSNRYLLFNIPLPCSGQMFATSKLAMTSEQCQLVFTCLKSRMETPEQCMTSVQS